MLCLHREFCKHLFKKYTWKNVLYPAAEARTNAQHDWIPVHVLNTLHSTQTWGPTWKPSLVKPLLFSTSSLSTSRQALSTIPPTSVTCLSSQCSKWRLHELSPPALTPSNTPQSTVHPTNSGPSVSSINRQSNRSPYPKRPSGAWRPTYRVVISLVICKPLHSQAQFCSQIAPVLTNSALEQNWDSWDHIHDSLKHHMASCLCSFPEVYL